MTTSASAVSAALRRGGLNPVAASDRHRRDGISATNSGDRVFVSASVGIGSTSPAIELEAAAERRLIAAAIPILRGAGYQVDTVDYSSLYVSRP